MANLSRRQFGKTVVGGLVTGFVPGTTERLKANPFVIQALRGSAIWLAEHLLAPATVSLFVKWVENVNSSRIVETPPPKSFHQQFSPPVMFADEFNPVRTPFGIYYGVEQFPGVAPSRTIDDLNELNLGETVAVKNTANPYLWSSSALTAGLVLRNVPVPQTERLQPRPVDHRAFGVQAAGHQLHPGFTNLHYVRFFRNAPSGLELTGYAWSSKLDPNQQGILLVPRIA